MSSSEEEDLSKFAEAADVNLFNNNLFNCTDDQDNHVPKKMSQRFLETPEENRIALKVTPGFQKHVACHLMRMLDSSLDQVPATTEKTSTLERDSNGNCRLDACENEPEGGIKLFGASAAFLASCNITPPPPTKRRKRGRKAACISSASEGDSSSNEEYVTNASPDKSRKLGVHDEVDLSERFAACAVSSEWILNGEAVKGWAPSYRRQDVFEGEATPDLIKMTSVLSMKKKKKKRKKNKEETNEGVIDDTKGMRKYFEILHLNKNIEEASQSKKKRGKRGRKKNKTKSSDVTEHPPGDEETALKPLKEKTKQHEEFDKRLYEEISNSGDTQGAENMVVRSPCLEYLSCSDLPKRHKKKKKRCKVDEEADRETLNILRKKMKKKKRRKERENGAVLEDEGFDSDPTKTDTSKRRKFLKLQKKKWKKKMEFLSKDLANLMMTNVKQD